MKQNILLPTDFSDNSWSAIVYVLKLYADEPCTFYLLNSINIRVSSMINITGKLEEIMRENAMKELQELKKQAEEANANANHDFEIILSSEELVDALKTAVEKHDINLVVTGTKGATGAKEFFFGSNTVKIIKKMKLCPVLVVPNEFDFVLPKQIAFPSDFNRSYSDKELKSLKDLANLYDSKIKIVHINVEKKLDSVQMYNMTKLGEHLEHYEHSFHWMPDYTKKAIAINEFIEELEINILVMVNYKHSFIESIVNEPVIKTIGFHPIIPFLVIPE